LLGRGEAIGMGLEVSCTGFPFSRPKTVLLLKGPKSDAVIPTSVRALKVLRIIDVTVRDCP
jgi:hypothetical protein